MGDGAVTSLLRHSHSPGPWSKQRSCDCIPRTGSRETDRRGSHPRVRHPRRSLTCCDRTAAFDPPRGMKYLRYNGSCMRRTSCPLTQPRCHPDEWHRPRMTGACHTIDVMSEILLSPSRRHRWCSGRCRDHTASAPVSRVEQTRSEVQLRLGGLVDKTGPTTTRRKALREVTTAWTSNW